VGSRNLVAIAMQPSFANTQVRDEVAQRSKEIALGFFFDELFAVGRFGAAKNFQAGTVFELAEEERAPETWHGLRRSD